MKGLVHLEAEMYSLGESLGVRCVYSILPVVVLHPLGKNNRLKTE